MPSILHTARHDKKGGDDKVSVLFSLPQPTTNDLDPVPVSPREEDGNDDHAADDFTNMLDSILNKVATGLGGNNDDDVINVVSDDDESASTVEDNSRDGTNSTTTTKEI